MVGKETVNAIEEQSCEREMKKQSGEERGQKIYIVEQSGEHETTNTIVEQIKK